MNPLPPKTSQRLQALLAAASSLAANSCSTASASFTFAAIASGVLRSLMRSSLSISSSMPVILPASSGCVLEGAMSAVNRSHVANPSRTGIYSCK